jgi:hypothetical protein
MQEEESINTEQIENGTRDSDQTWQETEWYQKQEQQSQEWKRLREADEGTP